MLLIPCDLSNNLPENVFIQFSSDRKHIRKWQTSDFEGTEAKFICCDVVAARELKLKLRITELEIMTAENRLRDIEIVKSTIQAVKASVMKSIDQTEFVDDETFNCIIPVDILEGMK